MIKEEIKSSLDLESIRKDFPLLDKVSPETGKKLVYLDSAATSLKPLAVINTMRDYMLNENATVRRGVYNLSANSTKRFDEARVKVQKFINANSPDEIIFTRGTTESINLVASSFSKAFLQKGDEVVISTIEHHANIVPWQIACEEHGAKLKVIPINDNGDLILEEYEKLLSEKVRIVAVTHVSNSLGTINPVKKMIELAHKHSIPVLIDGAQAIQHQKTDVQELDADFYAFSGHKVYGPTGIGALYGKRKWLEEMPPYHGGGEMISRVSFEGTTYADIPFKFEAGTPAIAEVIGLGAAIDYIQEIGLDSIKEQESKLLDYATKKAKEIEGLKIIGQAKEKAGVLSFTLDFADAFDIGTLLNEHEIAIRMGHHCAQPTMDRFGISATARISVAFYNTQDDLDRFFNALEEICSMLRPL